MNQKPAASGPPTGRSTCFCDVALFADMPVGGRPGWSFAGEFPLLPAEPAPG